MQMIRIILIQQIYCILFIVFLLTTSLVLANQYSQEELNEMKEYMKEYRQRPEVKAKTHEYYLRKKVEKYEKYG